MTCAARQVPFSASTQGPASAAEATRTKALARNLSSLASPKENGEYLWYNRDVPHWEMRLDAFHFHGYCRSRATSALDVWGRSRRRYSGANLRHRGRPDVEAQGPPSF